MKLTRVKIADLQPHPMNYNTHPEAQLAELEKSLESFDQFKNIVVCNGVILAGHGLVQAAKRRGLTELDAVVMDDLTDEQQKALLIADNALPFLAIPDSALLQGLLDDLGDYEIPGVNEEWMASFDLSGLNSDVELDFDESLDSKPKEETEQCPKCGFIWQR